MIVSIKGPIGEYFFELRFQLVIDVLINISLVN